MEYIYILIWVVVSIVVTIAAGYHVGQKFGYKQGYYTGLEVGEVVGAKRAFKDLDKSKSIEYRKGREDGKKDILQQLKQSYERKIEVDKSDIVSVGYDLEIDTFLLKEGNSEAIKRDFGLNAPKYIAKELLDKRLCVFKEEVNGRGLTVLSLKVKVLKPLEK